MDYKKPELEIAPFDIIDVVTASTQTPPGGDPSGDGGFTPPLYDDG